MNSPECVHCGIRVPSKALALCVFYTLEPTCMGCLREGVKHAYLAPDEVDIDFHRAIGAPIPDEALRTAEGL